MTDFAVPAAGVEVSFEERKSVFLTRLERVATEADARAVIAEARARHRDARHHCSAFVLGEHRDTQRSSDDGEPAGTAGMPILEVLNRATVQHLPLNHVVAVVTRWFGGVKLGAGGLTRAYSESASRAVEAAPWLRHARRRQWHWEVSHADAARFENGLRQAGHEVAADYHATGARLTVLAPDAPEAALDLRHECETIASDTVDLTAGEAVWVDLPL